MRAATTVRSAGLATVFVLMSLLLVPHTAYGWSRTVEDGCTFNTTTFDGYALSYWGHMTQCPRHDLTVDARLIYDGATVPGTELNKTCQNSTGCSLPTYSISECWAPGNYMTRVKGYHGSAVDYADVSWTVAALAVQPACAAAQLQVFATMTTAEKVQWMAAHGNVTSDPSSAGQEG